MTYMYTLFIAAALSSPQNIEYANFIKPIQNNSQQIISYEEIHDEALFNCPFSRVSVEKQKIISKLIEVEKSFNLPPNLRGMLLAAACHESGYETSAKGDYKVVKGKKKAMALGLFQMWPWWERYYKISRTHVEDSADAYMKHIKKMYKKVNAKCNIRTDTKRWLAAWATAIRAPKPGGRCNERPKFYRILKRWHKNIQNYRESDSKSCDGKEACGC